MTAPVEVTLHTMNDFSVITAIETNGGIPIGMMSGTEQTRYLRANLTCGECASVNNEDLCPYLKGTEIACMAFVPKEKR